jgi:ABC-type transport system involved in multi-copper enzyme maturation permease subunit
MITPNTLVIYTRHLLGRFGRTGIWWVIGLAIYNGLLVMTYPSFRESGLLAIENFPKGLVEAFGIEDLTKIEPYLDARLFGTLPLVLAFFPIMTFANAIAGAEERGALDILLGNPIPRRNVVLSNWIAMAVVLIGVLLISAALTWASGVIVDVGLDPGDTFRGMLNLFSITMFFGSFALALSARLRQRGLVIGISFALLFLMYLLDIIGRISPTWENVHWASAFRFYRSAMTAPVLWLETGILLGANLALVGLAVVLFNRRDIYT